MVEIEDDITENGQILVKELTGYTYASYSVSQHVDNAENESLAVTINLTKP